MEEKFKPKPPEEAEKEILKIYEKFFQKRQRRLKEREKNTDYRNNNFNNSNRYFDMVDNIFF